MISEGVRVMLAELRQHPSFPELLKLIHAPELKPFSRTAENVESAKAQWIFDSGRKRQHEQWVALLNGDVFANEKEKT